MGKFLDIHPIRKSNNSTVKSKTKNSDVIFFSIVVIIGLLFVSSLANGPTENAKNANSVTPSSEPLSTPTNSANPDKNDSSLPEPPNSTGSETTSNYEKDTLAANTQNIDKAKISIRMLDGSKTTDRLQIVSDKLENAGFIVATTGQAANYYKSTVVYFKSGREDDANLVLDLLTENKISKSENTKLVGNYDLLIVVGKE
jgi:hypothetical protein